MSNVFTKSAGSSQVGLYNVLYSYIVARLQTFLLNPSPDLVALQRISRDQPGATGTQAQCKPHYRAGML